MIWFLSLLLLLFSFTGSVLAHGQGADFDADGIVGYPDFLLFAVSYGSFAPRFDLTNDGRVDFKDFLTFVSVYGKVVHEDGEIEIGAETSTFEILQREVFNKSCISSSCHTTTGAAGVFSLEPNVAYTNLIAQTPKNTLAQKSGMKLVVPGNPSRSFLFRKITGSGAGFGDPMPRGSSLSGIQIDAVRIWIAAGAPLNGKVEGIPDLTNPVQSSHFEPPTPPSQGIQVHLKPFAVAPQEEREIFSTIALAGIKTDLMVNRIEIVQPEGSHHFIIYQLDGDEASSLPDGIRDLDNNDPTQSLGIFDRRFIIGGQFPYVEYQFPKGVALPMSTESIYEFNSHFVNTSGVNTLVAEVYVNLHTIPSEEVRYTLKPLFVSHFGFAIPPGQRITSGIDWSINEDINLLLLSSHMHRHGKMFDIFHNGQLIYQSIDWTDPKTRLFAPPLYVKAGEKFHFECTHLNDDKDFTLRFGFTAENDEMCIMLGFYY